MKKIIISLWIIFLALSLIACRDAKDPIEILNETYDDIVDQIPDQITGDVYLPMSDNASVDISYDSNDIEVYENILIYNFPETEYDMTLFINLTYQSTTLNYTVNKTVLAYDQIPKLPEIHIQTNENVDITSRDEYVHATLDLKSFDEDLTEQTNIEEAGIRIRLRGNSTFYMPKKSYKIKFDTKSKLLSDYKEKDWVLLANYTDQSLIRNALAFRMSERMDMAFSPMSQFVDVYVNGEYQGNYLLTDQIEATNDRVDIEEGSSQLDTGYLLELDNRLYSQEPNEIDENYFIIYGYYFVVKSPDWEDSTYQIDQLYYIEDYMNTLYLTLENGDDYSELIVDCQQFFRHF